MWGLGWTLPGSTVPQGQGHSQCHVAQLLSPRSSMQWWIKEERPRDAPHGDQIFLDFMQFSGNFNKIVSRHPLPTWGLAMHWLGNTSSKDTPHLCPMTDIVIHSDVSGINNHWSWLSSMEWLSYHDWWCTLLLISLSEIDGVHCYWSLCLRLMV